MISDAEPFVLTGVVVAEILQGLTRDASRIEHYLSQWEMIEPRGFRTYFEAAAIFRLGRAKGVSLTTIDALIAAIALAHRQRVYAGQGFFPNRALDGSSAVSAAGTMSPGRSGIPRSYCGSSRIIPFCLV